MSRITLMLVAVLAFGVSMAFAEGERTAPTSPPKAHGLAGVVKSADLTAKTFVLTVGEGEKAKDMPLKFGEKTIFRLDGAESTADKVLVAGAKVRVEPGKEEGGPVAGVMSGAPKRSGGDSPK